MRRTFQLVIAMLAAIVSLVWGLVILASDVTLSPPNKDGLACGGVFGSLISEPSYGGEQPYPDNWVQMCRDAAADQAVWALAPALIGLIALGYLAFRWTAVVREAKAHGRSSGALSR